MLLDAKVSHPDHGEGFVFAEGQRYEDRTDDSPAYGPITVVVVQFDDGIVKFDGMEYLSLTIMDDQED